MERRIVGGLATKPCQYCGRIQHATSSVAGQQVARRPYNYQYKLNERWDSHVFCSAAHFKAWHDENQ